MNAQSLFYELRKEGYEDGAPSWGADYTDRGVCNNATCEKCGYHGLIYRGFIKPGSYRAFAVCPQCEDAQEF